MKNLQSVTFLTEIVPFRLFHFSVSPLNSLIFCFLNVLILSVLRLHKLSKLPYTTVNFTVIAVLQLSVKSIGKCKKKKSLYNQPKSYFFKKLLWSHFWIDFNKFYTKTFKIVYILFVYLLKSLYDWFLFVHNFSMIVNF